MGGRCMPFFEKKYDRGTPCHQKTTGVLHLLLGTDRLSILPNDLTLPWYFGCPPPQSPADASAMVGSFLHLFMEVTSIYPKRNQKNDRPDIKEKIVLLFGIF